MMQNTKRSIYGADNDDKEIVPNTTTGTTNAIMNLRLAQCTENNEAVNGLICFVCGYDNAACIYNISTREITPWIKSTVLMEDRKKFDVGSEKFRTIQISKFRSGNSPSDPIPFLDSCHLLEVNGCVAILRRIIADTANLWVYDDSDKESTYKGTSMDSTDKNWIKNCWNLATMNNNNTITLPVPWVEGRDFYFHTASGADQIILETHLWSSDGCSKAESIYSYDLKKKFFEEIKISGIPLSVPVCFDTRLCTSFCESLMSLSEA
ncbi:hypothetical protein MKX01_017217 [Papaver californicum]|nr:hypothetical protein MKX01_017217 [Papaver californicum]